MAHLEKHGITMCMALIQDLLKEIQELKESRDDLRLEVDGLNDQLSQLNMNELADRILAMEQYCHQVEDLDNTTKELKDKMAQYPAPEELTQCVTWEVMQAALISERQKIQEGLQDTLSAAKNIAPVHPLNLDLSRRVSPPQQSLSDGALCTVTGRRLSRVSIGAECYPETVEALMEVGGLRDRHESLEARVGQLEANKADQTQLQHLRDLLNAMEERQIPDHVPEQLNHLRALVDSLLADKEKNTNLVSDLEGAILQLQSECEKLHRTSNRLMEEHSKKQTHIDRLFKIVEELDEKKADKQVVEMEIEIKADKRALESKVSRMQFDSMAEQLNNMIQDLLRKISGQEQDWNKVIEKISTEMDCKPKRAEFMTQSMLGMRLPSICIIVQLVARFHCISCDRPVDMMTPGQNLVTLPSAPGLPSHKSSRPYTVYELEQVRQHCRSERIPEMADYCYLSRNCGGSHTLTYPSRRYTRLQHITHLIQSEEESRPVSTGPPTQAAEVDILGLDGQVYKGRMSSRAVRLSETRFPTISPREGNWKSKDKVSRSQSQRSSGVDAGRGSPARPQSAKTHRSHSASSTSMKDRPLSSMDCLSQDVPLQTSLHDSTTEPKEALERHKELNQSEDEPVTSL
ncbi:glutamine-rich protein 2 [Sinocyclocheilus rhinocerous]|uniref:glutamine-rich protein 2 n=1 Tax=Sinocyclocheilus rhinocerous TaxID=307959 RepID=UPI0007B80624|nr:PREDICTED: glutamine-rich protein 2-like [Sinocyclocheilus rhinocerous]